MGILEDILSRLTNIEASLAGAAPATEKPATKPSAKKAADKGPSLEDVQNQIRELAEKGEAAKSKIKAAIVDLGGKRAGDFEGDADKLKKLKAALDGIAAGEEEPAEEEDDLL